MRRGVVVDLGTPQDAIVRAALVDPRPSALRAPPPTVVLRGERRLQGRARWAEDCAPSLTALEPEGAVHPCGRTC